MLNNHGASAGDIGNDGDLDLLVNALMFDGNFLYLNNGLGVRPVGSSPTGCLIPGIFYTSVGINLHLARLFKVNYVLLGK